MNLEPDERDLWNQRSRENWIFATNSDFLVTSFIGCKDIGLKIWVCSKDQFLCHQNKSLQSLLRICHKYKYIDIYKVFRIRYKRCSGLDITGVQD